MKTYNDLKAAVLKANSPAQAAGTFIDGVSSIIETHRDDPSNLSELVGGLRSNRDSFVNSITGGPKLPHST